MSRRKLTTSSATWWAFDSAELSETYHIHPVPMWQQLLPLSSFLATLVNRWHITHMVSPPLPPYLEFTHRAHLAGLMMYVVPEALVRLLLLCCSYGMKHDETIHPQTAKKYLIVLDMLSHLKVGWDRKSVSGRAGSTMIFMSAALWSWKWWQLRKQMAREEARGGTYKVWLWAQYLWDWDTPGPIGSPCSKQHFPDWRTC